MFVEPFEGEGALPQRAQQQGIATLRIKDFRVGAQTSETELASKRSWTKYSPPARGARCLPELPLHAPPRPT